MKSDTDYVTTGLQGYHGHSVSHHKIPQPEAPEYLYEGYKYELVSTAIRSIDDYNYQIFWTWKLVKDNN